MSRPPLPDPWGTALEPKGVTTRRGLATKAGIAPQTAQRLIDGVGRPSPETVAAVAQAIFDGDRDVVWSLAGYATQDHGDWRLPPEASLLDAEQRAAVLAVVRAMLPAEARHLAPADDKAARRTATEPTVEQVRGAKRANDQLRAVADQGNQDDADAVDELARQARIEQTGREE